MAILQQIIIKSKTAPLTSLRQFRRTWRLSRIRIRQWLILEIGAGTGGATLPVLEALASHGMKGSGLTRYSRYDFTDITAGFFERALEKFKDHRKTMNFKVLDIEIDPCRQGYHEGEYDLIIAANVSRFLARTPGITVWGLTQSHRYYMQPRIL